jgi:penicillin-binding protein 1B
MDRSTPPRASLRLGVPQLRANTQSRKATTHSYPKSYRWKALLRLTVLLLAVGLISFGGFCVYSYRSCARLVDARLAHGYLISRGGIYAAPRILRRGQKLTPDGLAAALRRAGYIEGEDATEIWNGSFTSAGDSIEIRQQPSPATVPGRSSAGSRLAGPPTVVQVRFDSDDRIADLTSDEISIDSFALAPESLTNDALTKGGVRRQLTFRDIPPVLIQAITSIEDRRFFDHHGLDIFGVARALIRNAGDERVGQGGSTITQQLVKNTYLTPERTLRRKYAEAMLAFTLERRLSKEDIFALYCNEIYLGQRKAFAVRGVEQAAHVYFGKRLSDLTLAEAATIAGMIQSPSRYSPIQHHEDTRARRNTVLGTMVRDGFIKLEEAAATASEPLTIAEFDPARESVAPHFIDYVNRASEAGASATADSITESFDGKMENEIGDTTYASQRQVAGTPIITTLDLDLQQSAAQAINHELDRLDRIYAPRGLTPQAALVVLDPKTGNVLAMVGGRDYEQSQLNRATDAKRQPGSVFKPFVYAAALESGMSPLQIFRDAPQEFTYAGKMKYRPSNYGGAFSMQDVTMRTGLIKSLNVVTVDVAMQTGLARVANTAAAFGLPRPKPYPALSLGTTEVTPLQIAAAYATFANGGQRIQPHVLDCPDIDNEIRQVIQPQTAFIITDMLEGVIQEGTARATRGSIKNTAIAGKTGTSRDGWFVGYTPNLVCAVWIGFDDNKQLGLTGAEAALPVWTEFMKAAVDLRPELGGRKFAQPDGVTIVDIDPETEELATGKCPTRERVALLTTQAPTAECFRHNIYFDLSDDSAEVMSDAVQPPQIRNPKWIRPNLTRPRSTEVEIDSAGRKVLVNDLRLAER